MPRIKKRGLDYFPINTDFIHDRLVRRIMKREGDAALAVLIETLSYIYADEGYYVRADDLFYEDLSANLYEKSADDVRRIVGLAVEYGVFDTTLFGRYGILTSADIQRQYLFSTKRRNVSGIEPKHCLLEENECLPLQSEDKKEKKATKKQESVQDTEKNGDNEKKNKKKEERKNENRNENVTFVPEKVTSGTHSIAQHSVAENRKEYLPSPPIVGQEEENPKRQEGDLSLSENACGNVCEKAENQSSQGRRKEWTPEMIGQLKPPVDDNQPRNYEGLLYNLRVYAILPDEQYAIIRKSNFGVIGNPVWKGLCSLRDSNGKIKLPGRYLLSILNK